MVNRPFPSSPGPLFQNEGGCSAFDMEIIFHSHANKTHFHKKGCAPSLTLKVRVFGTRKWPIRCWLLLYVKGEGFTRQTFLIDNLSVHYLTGNAQLFPSTVIWLNFLNSPNSRAFKTIIIVSQQKKNSSLHSYTLKYKQILTKIQLIPSKQTR